MSEPLNSRKRAPGGGRKPTDPDTHIIKKSISLKPETHENLLQIGEGKLSRGVQTVTDFYLKNTKLTKGKP